MAKKTAPSQAERRVGLGRGGRLDSASVIGTRAIMRAGHHAAPTAVTSASTTTATTIVPGRLSRPMRWFAAASSKGDSDIQRTAPIAVPASGRYQADQSAVREHHVADVLLRGADGGQHAQLTQPALGDGGEPGGGHKRYEQEEESRRDQGKGDGRLRSRRQ